MSGIILFSTALSPVSEKSRLVAVVFSFTLYGPNLVHCHRLGQKKPSAFLADSLAAGLTTSPGTDLGLTLCLVAEEIIDTSTASLAALYHLQG